MLVETNNFCMPYHDVNEDLKNEPSPAVKSQIVHRPLPTDLRFTHILFMRPKLK